MKLPNDTVEKLIANRFLRKSEYHPVILPNFDRRHYENKDIGLIMSILVEYTKKYSKVPSDDLAKLMLRKAAEPEDDERKPKHDARKLELEFESIASLDLKTDEEYVKENVVAFVKAKSFYFAIMDNLEVIEKDREVSKCQKEFEKISAIDFDQRLGMNYFDDLEQHMSVIANPEARLSTGFEQLDRVMNGGIYKTGKCLVCFMAQAGLGKSLMLSNLAVNFLKQNLSVVIVSLEMCEDVYAQRVDAHISTCDINQIRFNIEESTGKIQNFKKLYPKANLFIKDYPPETINVNVVKTYVEKIKNAGYPVDVIIVDYINLMVPNHKMTKDANSYERVGTVARELRALSYEFNAPVLSVTQVNRCLTLDTKVIVHRNHVDEEIAIKDVKAYGEDGGDGDVIKTNGGYNKIIEKHVIIKQKVYKITTKSGLTIKCSDKHVFPCLGGMSTLPLETSISAGLQVGYSLIIATDMHEDFDEIVSIEECGEEETIDITTDGNHLFFANGILTHNCGYDTSEVSMANTSESAGINHTVDFLGGLWQQDGDREANKLSMTVLKNRFGGMIGQTKEFFINYSNLRITDMEREVKDETKGEIDDILGDIEEV